MGDVRWRTDKSPKRSEGVEATGSLRGGVGYADHKGKIRSIAPECATPPYALSSF